jgi:hypothetical protein
MGGSGIAVGGITLGFNRLAGGAQRGAHDLDVGAAAAKIVA